MVGMIPACRMACLAMSVMVDRGSCLGAVVQARILLTITASWVTKLVHGKDRMRLGGAMTWIGRWRRSPWTVVQHRYQTHSMIRLELVIWALPPVIVYSAAASTHRTTIPAGSRVLPIWGRQMIVTSTREVADRWTVLVSDILPRTTPDQVCVWRF